MSGRLFHPCGIGLLASLLLFACSQPAKQAPQAAAISAPQAASSAPASAAPEQEQMPDQRMVLAAQRALAQLGYPVGSADGLFGPATRRAILAFQKDRGLAEDGRLSPALAALLVKLAGEPGRSNTTSVAAGDLLLFGDGSREIAKSERVVTWEQEAKNGLVAIRPSTAGWPQAARAGLDWAISHALEAAAGPPIVWSSTGVEQHFEIQVTAVSLREAALAGSVAQSCRHFDLREAERRYPGLVCRDANGEWYFFNSRIRLAHPARKLGPQTSASAPAQSR